jgi:HD-like signal output (HDOD) protein
MNRLGLDQLVDRVNQLPSLPAAVVELAKVLGDENVSIDRIAHDIAMDQALAARALRVANSPFYGLPHPVASIHDAIVVLGIRAVSGLVTTAALTEFFKGAAASWFDPAPFWRHSLGSALCARRVARATGLDGESGYTAGLIHDIGCLLLAVCCPEPYRAALAWRGEHDCTLVEAERAVLGLDHAQAGEVLARHWRFAPDLCEAVARHHGPSDPPPAGGRPTLADAIHLGCILAQALDLSDSPGAQVGPIDAGAWRRLGLGWPGFRSALPDIEREFQGYHSMLGGAT